MVTGIIVVTIALSFQCGHHFQICDLVEVVECDMVQQITYTTTTCTLCNRCLKKTKIWKHTPLSVIKLPVTEV